MKYIRNVFAFLLILMLINEGEVVAMNTGFSTGTLSKNDIETFIENVNISILENEPQRQAIECFDVDEEGTIAIGYSDSQNKTVCIYTNNGDFQYGYSFECSGKFGIEIHNRVLNIYFVRSGVIASVNPSGEVLDIKEVQDTTENNSYYYRFFRVAERTVGDTTYLIRSNMGILNWITASYSQVVVKEFDGTENIIYDASSIQLQRMTIIFIAILLFLAIFIWRIYCYYCMSGR